MSSIERVGEMQFDRWTGGAMGMSSVYRVRLVVRVGEMSSTDRVGEKQFDWRMSGTMRSMVLVSDEADSAESVSITGVVKVGGDVNEKTFSTNLT